METYEERLTKIKEELMHLNAVINGLECWGPNAESLQRDYDYILHKYNKLLKEGK